MRSTMVLIQRLGQSAQFPTGFVAVATIPSYKATLQRDQLGRINEFGHGIPHILPTRW